MGLTGCYGCIKYLMVFINVIFWVLGCVVVGLAIWMLTDPTFYFSMTQEENHYNIALYVMLGIGALWLIVAFLGCCGAFKESQCMLISFFAFLLVILVAEVAAGGWAYFHADSLELKIRKAVKMTVQEEYIIPANSRTLTFDVIQKELRCCGADGPGDWSDSKYSKLKRSKEQGENFLSLAVSAVGLKYYIPPSCCKEDISKETCNDAISSGFIGSTFSNALNKQGCTDKFVETLKQHVMIVTGVTIAIIAMEVLGIIFSLVLCFAINRSERYKA